MADIHGAGSICYMKWLSSEERETASASGSAEGEDDGDGAWARVVRYTNIKTVPIAQWSFIAGVEH